MADPSARWTAAARARESARGDRLFDDPWAADLAAGTGAGAENPYLPVRTRYFDDAVLAAAAPQVVLLGAGLDTRAWRLPLDPATVVFEVDRPGALGDKRARIPQEPVCGRREVAADLGTADWSIPGLDEGAPVLWVAEGLLFHLSPDAVDRVLARAAGLSGGGGRFLADVFGTGLLRVPGAAGFCTDDPRGLFARAGWTAVTWELAGSPAANYGRLTGDGGRTYFVAASV
ncbi:class I SAM-dependent methyltransferase [Dactylosporangium sp. CS-033363]|uniref:class I SAM-dependent methyltransferase n=1 Tax=Dactylosporangium sp. CS-033363 TaxID=3239935 RepID=UPI003D91C4B4